MSIRNSEEYKNMDLFTACATVENWNDEELSEEQVVAAWQYLYDNQAYNWLQGWYGRTMRDLAENGMIEP